MSYINYNKVHQLIKLHREDQALKMVRDFIAQDPEFGGYFHILAYLLSNKGNHHAALKAVNTAIRLEPEKASYVAQKADFLIHTNLHSALKTIDLAIAMNPNDYRSHITKAHILYALRNYDTAYAAINKALSLEPNRPQILNLKYHIQIALGLTAKARTTLLSSLEIDAGNSETLSLLGRHDLDRNQVEETSSLFKSALQSDPNSVKAQIGLKESVYRSNRLYNRVNNYRLKLHRVRSLTYVFSLILLFALCVGYTNGYLYQWFNNLDSLILILGIILLLHVRWLSPALLVITYRDTTTRLYNSFLDKKIAPYIRVLFISSRYSLIAGVLFLGLSLPVVTPYLTFFLFKVCFSSLAVILMLDHYRYDRVVNWEWTMIVVFWGMFIAIDLYITATAIQFMNIGFILNLIFVTAYFTLKQVATKQDLT